MAVKLPAVYLYSEPTAPTLDLGEIGAYLERLLPVKVEVREGIVPFYLGQLPAAGREEALAQIAQGFARLKIRNPMRQEPPPTPLPGEIDYEQRRLSASPGLSGVAYEGVGVMRLMEGLLPAAERRLSCLHIIFTNQLLVTWGEGRYHLRVAVFGFPCLLSTTGAVEAPAKPREYYILKQRYSALGMPDAVVELEEELGERILRHDDGRLTEVMKGYVMQAMFHHIDGDPFCPDPDCRLFNAHWQQELLRAQLHSPYQFCPDHQRRLEELREEGGK